MPLLLLGFVILTGEPLMFTKALVLLTDRFIGGFGPVEAAGLPEGGGLEIALLSKPKRTGEVKLFAGEEGVRGVFGEEMGLVAF